MKKFLRIIRNVALAGVFLLALSVLLTKVFEKQIINKGIELINQKISVPVSVDKITVSVLRNFPNITLQLHNVIVESPINFNSHNFKQINESYLLKLESVFLSFNIKALLKQTFELSQITLSHGHIQLLVDTNGTTNYNIFPSNTTKTQSANFKVLLNSVQFLKLNFTIVNAYKNSHIKLFTKKLTAKGNFYKQKYTVSTIGSVQINSIKSGSLTYIPANKTALSFNLAINNDTINIQKGQFHTKGLSFITKGQVIYGPKPYLDLSINGKNLKIESLLGLWPLTKQQFAEYDAFGNFAISTRIKGYLSETSSPKIKSNFTINQGKLLHKHSGLTISQVNLSGQYSNYSKPVLNIPEFSFKTDSSTFNGSLKLSSLNHPYINLVSTFNINVNDIFEIVNNDAIASLSGNINGNINANGILSDEFNVQSYFNILEKSTINTNNINLSFSKDPLNIRQFSGRFILENNSLSFKNIIGYYMGSKMQSSGNITNLSAIISPNYQPIKISAKLSLDMLNYKNIDYWFSLPDDTSTTANSYFVDLNLALNTFVYNKLLANNVTGKMVYKNNLLEFNNLNFSAFNGRVESTVRLNMAAENSMLVYTHANTRNVEISSLFDTFNNFDQQFIKSTNIKGRLNSNFDGEMFIINSNPDLNTLDLLGHIEIVKGELINFEPVQNLSRFSDITELKHLKFDTLKNDILIGNGKITIPSMKVSNNALNMHVFGEQELNGNYKYHVNLSLSELLSKKSKRLKQRQSNFGTIQDDGHGKMNIYLIATAKNGNSQVKFDKVQRRKNLHNQLKNEKRELKQVVKKEFGWFKNDSVEVNEPTKEKYFEIEWDSE